MNCNNCEYMKSDSFYYKCMYKNKNYILSWVSDIGEIIIPEWCPK